MKKQKITRDMAWKMYNNPKVIIDSNLTFEAFWQEAQEMNQMTNKEIKEKMKGKRYQRVKKAIIEGKVINPF